MYYTSTEFYRFSFISFAKISPDADVKIGICKAYGLQETDPPVTIEKIEFDEYL